MVKWKIGLLGRIYTIGFSIRSNPLEPPVLGIRSNLDTLSIYNPLSRHLLMLDFDDLNSLEALRGKIRILQTLFRLGDCYIYESSRIRTESNSIRIYPPFFGKTVETKSKYHGYFFQDSMTYFEALRIIHYCANTLKIVDPQYAKWRMMRPNCVLRLSPKKDGFVPSFIDIVKSPYSHYEDEVAWFKDFVNQTLEEIALKEQDNRQEIMLDGKGLTNEQRS